MAYNLDLLTDNKLVLSKKSELPYTKCINRIRIPTKKERAVVNEKKSDFLMFGDFPGTYICCFLLLLLI